MKAPLFLADEDARTIPKGRRVFHTYLFDSRSCIENPALSTIILTWVPAEVVCGACHRYRKVWVNQDHVELYLTQLRVGACGRCGAINFSNKERS